MPKPELFRASLSLKTKGNSTFWIYSEHTDNNCNVEISYDGTAAWFGPVVMSEVNLHRATVICTLTAAQIETLLEDIEEYGNLADVSITVTNQDGKRSDELEEEVIIDGP